MTTLYANQGSSHKFNAQRNLQGRTHYVDDDTLKYFHSRIISAKATTDGLLFAIITSDAQDYENKSRGFRYVIFDLFGTVIERNPGNATIDDRPFFKTSEKARLARDVALAAIDAKAHTLKAITRERRNHETDMDRLEAQVTCGVSP